MDLVPGDVVLIEIQFHQKPGAKVRPAVAILGPSDTVAGGEIGAPPKKRRQSGTDNPSTVPLLGSTLSVEIQQEGQ